MSLDALREAIERLAAEPRPDLAEALPIVAELLEALESGRVRAAAPSGDSWTVHAWVKKGILLAFRVGVNASTGVPPVFYFRDRDTLPTLAPESGGGEVRIVPGGTTVRRGVYLGRGVVIMPPAFVNVGAWVGAETMIDSHALVGSCAQVGSRVHVSAAAQIGGVLEPPGAMPVVVEDEAFIGGGCGVYEGTRVRRRAVLAAGVVLARSVPIYDLVREAVLRPHGEAPLTVPEGAVVVPGARAALGPFAEAHGLSLQAPIIVKYRDEATDASAALEEALR